MRIVPIVLAAACLFASPATAAPPQVLGTKADFVGGAVTGVTFQVREGEKYLHLVLSGNPGDVVADVTTNAGTVRICQNTKIVGPLPIEGRATVTVTPVLKAQSRCGRGLSATGTVLALFANRSLSLADAEAIMQPDPSREVTGGI